ncbi:hypothetical protein [Halalkalibacter akibai]|uniref:Uncharacterized protein n=1 Tax=Halalkalibacter akibai (strain ATCC 43226 / DSM 21942 / CIP 109018 / JCM 9157 / 1139) TaxID=1236973 RepID=W4R0T4_HALA3|nr:hypothetical protein [Halalkalibacter akibai]GAE37508.1 hypothetical protein JCM9157_4814 [Halalkalibacter akibai JCM 9157]
MKIYKAQSKWVIGVEGGVFEEFEKQKEAIIVDTRPVAYKMWRTPMEVVENIFIGHLWEIEYQFLEYHVGTESIFVFMIERSRRKPGFIHYREEFFVSHRFVMSKVNSLRERACIAEYHWNHIKNQWIEIECLFQQEHEC